MESWEFERNNSLNVKFQDNDFATQAWDEKNQIWYPAWYDDWEARFPDDTWRHTEKLNEFVGWVKSTWREQATNENLTSPVTFTVNSTVTVDNYSSDSSYTITNETANGVSTGNKIITFTKDTPAYRLTKFKAELADYVELESALFYYIFTDFFLMIDSRAKNMFIGFNGSLINDPNRAMDRRVTFQPYDMDTAIGTNNSGVLMFGYALEDTDTVSEIVSGTGTGDSNAPVFNAQDSVFWCNLRDAFWSNITAMYTSLRSNPLFNYNAVEKMYEDHQEVWPEAIFNEDAWTKYIYPLIYAVTEDEETGQLIKTDRYLTMLQGSKKEQRKWWLSNRFRYEDSRFVTGSATTNIISMRIFNNGTMYLKGAIDMYLGVSYGGGTTVSLQRALAGEQKAFPYQSGSTVTELETWIYSGDYITDVGDLSVFYPNELDFSKAKRLRVMKIGDSSSGYSNANLRTFDVQNSTLLEQIDVRNCPNLAIAVNLENSPRLEKAYFTGTSITSISLADGCVIDTLHLPSTLTSLTLFNLSKLTDFQITSYANITTLMLTNISQSVINPVTVLNAIATNSLVNIQGLELAMNTAQDIEDFLDLLDTMKGVTRARGSDGEWQYQELPIAQVSGVIHIDSLTGAQIASYNERYQYLIIDATHTSSVIYFKTWDGEAIATVSCADGVMQSSAPSGPARASTAQYDYTFIGWNLDPDQYVADNSLLTNIIADRTVYAAYSRTTRSYAVTWKNTDGTVLRTTNVPYGIAPTFDGATPISPDGPVEDYTFLGWVPPLAPVDGTNLTYTAKYRPPFVLTEITDSWETIIESVENGTYKSRYKVGQYKPVDTVDANKEYIAQIVDFDVDVDKLGNTIPISFASLNLSNATHYYGTTNGDYGTQVGTGITNGYDIMPGGIKNHMVLVRKTHIGGNQAVLGFDARSWMLSKAELSKGYMLFYSNEYRMKTYNGTATSYWTRDYSWYGELRGGPSKYHNWYGVTSTGVIQSMGGGNLHFLVGFALGTYEQAHLKNVTWQNVLDSIDAGTYATDFAVGDIIPLTDTDGRTLNAEIVAIDPDNGQHLKLVTYRLCGPTAYKSRWYGTADVTAEVNKFKAKMPAELSEAYAVQPRVYSGYEIPSGKKKYDASRSGYAKYITSYWSSAEYNETSFAYVNPNGTGMSGNLFGSLYFAFEFIL